LVWHLCAISPRGERGQAPSVHLEGPVDPVDPAAAEREEDVALLLEAVVPVRADPVALVADWRSFEREYAGAAEELQETLDELGNELSPETRRIVERNLDVIDAAIAESRAALEGDPANWELARALRSAWSSKVEMLQYVTRL